MRDLILRLDSDEQQWPPEVEPPAIIFAIKKADQDAIQRCSGAGGSFARLLVECTGAGQQHPEQIAHHTVGLIGQNFNKITFNAFHLVDEAVFQTCT
ncbi:unnamed protein product [Gongylonema pulchrum]|uniref:Copine domain-containing protein n=1 Tax=Gongylonema pulchrum TaxID=637853 RepID=A0A183DW05_9BILA|nr:unnamed protein product [Gongylonema pulchrum]